MKKTTAIIAVALAGLVASGTFAGGSSEKSGAAKKEGENVTVKVGVVGENNAAWDAVAKNLAKEGITIDIVKFSDYTQPNQALADGELDINSFQHYAFLKKDSEARKLSLSVIGDTVIALARTLLEKNQKRRRNQGAGQDRGAERRHERGARAQASRGRGAHQGKGRIGISADRERHHGKQTQA